MMKTFKQDSVLFMAELKRAWKLLKVYPLDTVNSVISFVIVSVVFMIGIRAVGNPTQIFGVVFFPLLLNLISGPSASIRNDIEMGVFEQVYISKYSLIKVAVIRTIIAALSSLIGSVLIALIVHFFFLRITVPAYHIFFLLLLFGVQGLLLGIVLAAITIRYRKTETLLNSLNILFMILMVLPLSELSEKLMFIPSAVFPFWGLVAYYQELFAAPASPGVYINLLLVIVNSIFAAMIALPFYNKMLTSTKMRGFLGQY